MAKALIWALVSSGVRGNKAVSEHLYIHVPFCYKKCRYCDFYSEVDLSLVAAYVSAIVREIELRAPQRIASDQIPVKTIYFGGGTPSVLQHTDIAKILTAVHQHYPLAPSVEITLEANPGTLDRTYLNGLQDLGINRLSLGAQAFDDKRLAWLGRIHCADQAARAIEEAGAAGFNNLGLDLIYGLPGDTETAWQRELDRALSFGPAHLSCYMLTIEPGTPLFHACKAGQFAPMTAEAQVDLFNLTAIYLANAGYDQYEISNFAREDALVSRHNSAYWRMVPYTGFGPSAHSYTVKKNWKGNLQYCRSWNVSHLETYISDLSDADMHRLPIAECEVLSPVQQMMEYIMVGLRTAQGIDIHGFDSIQGASFHHDCSKLVARLIENGLGGLSENGAFFSLTRKGWMRLDSIVACFVQELPDESYIRPV
ncbi:MAG: coproporphyrinogen III oxidase [Desulfobacterales bacterium]|nr:MAG: coproporphyrinogen III oxidase [Desulfobacterales bacterium]